MSNAKRNIFVTTALPYANGAFHFGHILEYIQADIWCATSECAATTCILYALTTLTVPRL